MKQNILFRPNRFLLNTKISENNVINNNTISKLMLLGITPISMPKDESNVMATLNTQNITAKIKIK